jgi:MtN3 and saliva related transmembrane protein
VTWPAIAIVQDPDDCRGPVDAVARLQYRSPNYFLPLRAIAFFDAFDHGSGRRRTVTNGRGADQAGRSQKVEDPSMALDTSTLIIGALSAITSTGRFAPQAWKIIKTRETNNISTGMCGLTVAGFALWLAYGAMLGQWPLIATNSICRVLAAFILVMKILPTAGKRAVADTLDPSADGGGATRAASIDPLRGNHGFT